MKEYERNHRAHREKASLYSQKNIKRKYMEPRDYTSRKSGIGKGRG